MAISEAHFHLMTSLRDQLPRGGDVLQIGDANWYGDLNPASILELTDDPEMRAFVQRAIDSGNNFSVAKAFYGALFAPKRIDSIDINGSDGCLRLDLNGPVQLGRRYDLTVNHGTAEHVFNVAQVFVTMHNWTNNGGLMIHESPWLGWPDHGFWSLHPTLFFDLAAANEYQVVGVWVIDLPAARVVRVESRTHVGELLRDGKVPENATLFVVLRKGSGAFKLPFQGYYDGKLDEQGRKDWESMR